MPRTSNACRTAKYELWAKGVCQHRHNNSLQHLFPVGATFIAHWKQYECSCITDASNTEYELDVQLTDLFIFACIQKPHSILHVRLNQIHLRFVASHAAIGETFQKHKQWCKEECLCRVLCESRSTSF